MSRTLLFIGIALMIIAFVLLFFLIQGPSNPSVANMLESLLCEPEETISEYSSLTFRGTGTSRTTIYYCEAPNGTQRDVTGPFILILFGGFGVPFVIGLIMTIITANISVRRRTRAFTELFTRTGRRGGAVNIPGQASSNYTRTEVYNQANIPPETRQVLEQVFGNFDQVFDKLENAPAGTVITTSSGLGQPSLADRLRQLDEARDQGLINADEYAKARAAILDNFDG